MIKKISLYLVVTFFLILSANFSEAREVPLLGNSPILDEVGLLDLNTENRLKNQLLQLNRTQGVQLQVLIIESLEGDNLEDFSIRVVDSWKLGKKGEDKGVLFLIVYKDRKMRIEVGRGLEGELTDITSGRIIRSIKPYFVNNAYSEGILKAVEQITRVTSGKKLSQNSPKKRRMKRGRKNMIIFIILFIVFFISSKLQGGRPGGGSFGGGRGWSNRGGGFSGGGASGGW
jgi:uncharacterized protein